MNNFHVNQKVVCISDDWSTTLDGCAPLTVYPVLNGIYTITAVELWGKDETVVLHLKEMLPTNIFSASSFRPLVEKKSRAKRKVKKKTSIEVFEKIAANPKKKIKEPA